MEVPKFSLLPAHETLSCCSVLDIARSFSRIYSPLRWAIIDERRAYAASTECYNGGMSAASEKMAPALQQALQNMPAETALPLHVLLRAESNREDVERAVEDIGKLAVQGAPCEALKHQRILLCTARVQHVSAIAAHPAVLWVD